MLTAVIRPRSDSFSSCVGRAWNGIYKVGQFGHLANIGAFNLGNALGAWIGGMTISAGLGYTSPIWAGAAITLAAVLVLGLSMTHNRRTAHDARQGTERDSSPALVP